MSLVRVTRRRLLKTAAAGFVASPDFITSTALGNRETPPAGERVSQGTAINVLQLPAQENAMGDARGHAPALLGHVGDIV